ncbi:C4-dicarboxylate TRAP transporter large permease protein DctM [subsurface metagenome]
MGPPVPPEERYSWLEKFKSLKALVLPGLLIFIVLGLIILGVTSPTEAAAVGGLGALLIAGLHRTLSWKVLKEAVFSTGRIMALIMWIIVPAVAFSKIYHGLGAHQMIEGFIAAAGLSPTAVIVMMLVSYIFLGMFLETGAIVFLTIPLYAPIVKELGFDLIWFGTLYIMCCETAYLTPPYGFNLFYMRAIVPKEITMVDIYMSVIPFVGLQVIGLAIVVMLPQIALWLPNLIFGVSGG